MGASAILPFVTGSLVCEPMVSLWFTLPRGRRNHFDIPDASQNPIPSFCQGDDGRKAAESGKSLSVGFRNAFVPSEPEIVQEVL